jgi:hypothetical protein
MSKCQCESAGFCPLASRAMSAHNHRLCQTRPKYRALFQNLPQPERQPARRGPCRFTGPLVRLETCELGCAKGTKIKVVRCGNTEIGGEVSVVPYKRGQPEGPCKGCGGYEAQPPKVS